MQEFNELCQGMQLEAKIERGEWAESRTVKVVLTRETAGSATYYKNRAVKSVLDKMKARKKDPVTVPALHDQDGFLGDEPCTPKTSDSSPTTHERPVLGKRIVDEQAAVVDVPPAPGSNALVLFTGIPSGGVSKKGKAEESEMVDREKVWEDAMASTVAE